MNNTPTTGSGWPDPDRPGVPLNPHVGGWHWLALHGWEPVAWHWRAQFQLWGLNGYSPANVARGCAYLGPCLTPTQHAAAVEAAKVAGFNDGSHAGSLALDELKHTTESLQAAGWEIVALRMALGLNPHFVAFTPPEPKP